MLPFRRASTLTLMKRLLPAPVVLLVAALAGCDSDLPDRSEVEALRILGVRAEPPALADPGESELTALVADGQGARTYVWELCLVPGSPTDGFPCLDEAARFDLGDQPTATMAVPDLEPFLERAEEEGFTVDLEAGLDIQVKLIVGDETDREVTAIKRVRVSRRSDRNTNPVLEGIRVEGLAWSAGQAAGVRLGQEVVLSPVWDAESLETFEDDGQTFREDPLLSWFVEAGDLDRARSSGDRPRNAWRAPTRAELDERDDERREFSLWLVLRDGRGGIDWLERRIRLLDPEDGSPL